jgi:hypothetical protein
MTKINEINVELSGNSQRYVNEYCKSESDRKFDGFSAGCCKCRGGSPLLYGILISCLYTLYQHQPVLGILTTTMDLVYLFIYLFLILACNHKVMVDATYSNYKVGSLAITPGPHWDMPQSGHSVWRYSPPLLSLCMFHLVTSVPGALLAQRPPHQVVLHSLLPSPPVFSSFSHLCFLHSS